MGEDEQPVDENSLRPVCLFSLVGKLATKNAHCDTATQTDKAVRNSVAFILFFQVNRQINSYLMMYRNTDM